jgi:hypothetical protein
VSVSLGIVCKPSQGRRRFGEGVRGVVVAWRSRRLTQRMAQFPKKRTRAHSTRGWLSIITMAVAHPMGRTTFADCPAEAPGIHLG